MSTTPSRFARREFLKLSALSLGAAGLAPATVRAGTTAAAPTAKPRRPNEAYAADHLNRIAFPLGGFGSGMFCIEGTGALSTFSIRNRPDVNNEPQVFAAVAVRGEHPVARVLEGPVPGVKITGSRGDPWGEGDKAYGLPRFGSVQFRAEFPFAHVDLSDPSVPLAIQVTGWSPFTPGDIDNSSLPAAAIEYEFTNTSGAAVDAVFSFNARNLLAAEDAPGAVQAAHRGFALWGPGKKDAPWDAGHFVFAAPLEEGVLVNHAWFRGGWFDPLTMAWKDVESGAAYARAPVTAGDPAPGGSLFVPFTLAPGAKRRIAVLASWYVPRSHLRTGFGKEGDATGPTYEPWYAARFADIQAVSGYWAEHYAELRERSDLFARTFQDSTLPREVLEAVGANLGILKSPTVLRERNGRMWAWEGCGDEGGCCHGSCTHVWNYAQAVAHLFPEMERSLRETEFGDNQDTSGHQTFRACLPIAPQKKNFHAAADGQLGGLMKLYRDWRISGDTEWVRRLWPKARQSLDYCIELWDPGHKGWLEEPHHNTYDIEFWGPDGMCTSFYLGALAAAVRIGHALNDDVAGYEALLSRGRALTEEKLFDGEYFYQRIQWTGLRAPSPLEFKAGIMGGYSPEARALLEKEGPKYQYGTGCLSDGVLGAWLALVCGVGDVLDPEKVRSHLRSVHRYNLKRDLSAHVNPQRPGYALGAEGGLLLCTWPKGGALSLPFVYSNEVWTGIEYQVASHLILSGLVEEGLEIVRLCRDRYDGRVRNPFDEYECGHWYGRALASYGLLQALSGARYDAVERVLHLAPRVPGDFRAFLATATGYGVVGVKGGQPFVEVKSGRIDVQETKYVPAA